MRGSGVEVATSLELGPLDLGITVEQARPHSSEGACVTSRCASAVSIVRSRVTVAWLVEALLPQGRKRCCFVFRPELS